VALDIRRARLTHNHELGTVHASAAILARSSTLSDRPITRQAYPREPRRPGFRKLFVSQIRAELGKCAQLFSKPGDGIRNERYVKPTMISNIPARTPHFPFQAVFAIQRG